MRSRAKPPRMKNGQNASSLESPGPPPQPLLNESPTKKLTMALFFLAVKEDTNINTPTQHPIFHNNRRISDGVIDSMGVWTCRIGLVLDRSLEAQGNGFTLAHGCRVPDSTDLRFLARLNVGQHAWRSRRPSLEFDNNIRTPHLKPGYAGFRG